MSQLTGNAVFDGGAVALVGLILGGTAVWLAIETKGLLIREAADREVVHGIRKISVAYCDELETGDVEKAAAHLDIRIRGPKANGTYFGEAVPLHSIRGTPRILSCCSS